MKREKMLQELEEAAGALGLRVSYERLSAEAQPGGLCRVNGQYRVLVDRRAPVLDRVNVLLEAVARFSTEDLYLSPELRQRVTTRAAHIRRAAATAAPEQHPAESSAETAEEAAAGDAEAEATP